MLYNCRNIYDRRSFTRRPSSGRKQSSRLSNGTHGRPPATIKWLSVIRGESRVPWNPIIGDDNDKEVFQRVCTWERCEKLLFDWVKKGPRAWDR